MWTDKFNPDEGEVWVTVRLFGPLGDRYLNCLLDTGTPVTILHTAITDELGYNASMATGRSRLWGVGGTQEGYRMPVARLETMGLVLDKTEVHCHDLPEKLGVEGLIGMDLLKG